ncbi:SSI family serine proteinase inhibitor [Streptomyces sp. NBC_00536]|uniref:SSI family serine proteinase inhibitor n=1 Tax=Streptomyces sp. NBC_00536 TaxID=2975769 RepID=UPI003FCC5834
MGLASAAMALTALTALAGSGAADAAPSGAESLYAPSALVLGVTAGDDARHGTVLRAVTLVCAPRPSGTHPDPAAACTELLAAAGRPDMITEGGAAAVCTREYDPVTVTADGVWQGKRFTYDHTFANRCAMRAGSGAVFAF